MSAFGVESEDSLGSLVLPDYMIQSILDGRYIRKLNGQAPDAQGNVTVSVPTPPAPPVLTSEFIGFAAASAGARLSADVAGKLVYIDFSTDDTFLLPSSAGTNTTGLTFTVMQRGDGKATISAAGSVGVNGIFTSAGLVPSITTKGKGSVIKFVFDTYARWLVLPYGDSYDLPA